MFKLQLLSDEVEQLMGHFGQCLFGSHRRFSNDCDYILIIIFMITLRLHRDYIVIIIFTSTP